MNTRKHKRRVYSLNVRQIEQERRLNAMGYKTIGRSLTGENRLGYRVVRVMGEQA